MATWGASINANNNGSRWMANFAVSGESFPEDGTLDSVHLYGLRYSSGTYDYRVAVYEGGTGANDINTATKVWDSGQRDGTDFPAGSPDWVSISASGSLTSGARVWIMVKGTYSFYWYSMQVADIGDLNTETMDGSPPDDVDEGVAFDDPAVTGMTVQNADDGMKGYITYTAGGAAGLIAPPLLHSFAVQRAANY